MGNKNDVKLMVTLWPSFPHFERFAADTRLTGGVRMNSAMIDNAELETELAKLPGLDVKVPLWFDVKGKQLRVEEVFLNSQYLDMTLNHPIAVPTPTPVLFKAGADHALLDRLEEGGKRLIFRGGPHYMVNPGESIHIRHSGLQVFGDTFTAVEKKKIERVRQFGFKKYFLSYVEDQRMIDELRELAGSDIEIMLKIENKRGLDFVARHFRKTEGVTLVAARGDLYVELERPHEILCAVRMIAEKDAEACVGSRILLSVIHDSVPSNADFSELAWLYDIGYRRMMLCDELCLKEELLATAVNAFVGFRDHYCLRHRAPTVAPPTTPKKRGWLERFGIVN